MVEQQLERWFEDTYGIRGARVEVVPRIGCTLVRVRSGYESYWLRVSTVEARGQGEVEDEARALLVLREHDLSVPLPVARVDGQYAGHLAWNHGSEVAVLFHHVPGEALAAAGLTQLDSLGQALGRLHQLSGHVALPSRPPINVEYLVHAPLRNVEPWLKVHGLSSQLLTSQCHDLARRVEEAAAAWTNVFCHGDLHLGNVLFQGDDLTLLDFESCGFGPRPYDLACIWRKHVFGASDALEARCRWEALLAGYRRVAPLAEAEVAAIPALATLRAVCIMALPARPGCRWGRAWVTDGGYFEAHLEVVERFAVAAATTNCGA